MKSCIYEGRVRHSRKKPAVHEFNYRLFMMYVDLDELPTLFEKRWLWSASRRAPARFRRTDHLGPEDQSLPDSVRQLVWNETGKMPNGPIRLLTNLSYFGYCFNPVSFYYCFAPDGESVEFIVAEVSNTPWGECDTYVMNCGEEGEASSSWRFQPSKKMHVSPFMPMDVEYDWVLSTPADSLTVFMANSKDGRRLFDATLDLTRTEVTGPALARVLLRYPFMTAKIILSIYWEALCLWAKRCPVYQHPVKESEVSFDEHESNFSRCARQRHRDHQTVDT